MSLHVALSDGRSVEIYVLLLGFDGDVVTIGYGNHPLPSPLLAVVATAVTAATATATAATIAMIISNRRNSRTAAEDGARAQKFPSTGRRLFHWWLDAEHC